MVCKEECIRLYTTQHQVRYVVHTNNRVSVCYNLYKQKQSSYLLKSNLACILRFVYKTIKFKKAKE